MMIKTFRQILSLLHPTRRDYAVKYSRELRSEAEQNIEDMKADLNGCTDEWFLVPKSPLDECIPKDEDLR
jgi:hypothetical protein